MDVGAEDKKGVLELGVDVGCVITYPDEFSYSTKINLYACWITVWESS
jgi:putative aminopeptidase FrvX